MKPAVESGFELVNDAFEVDLDPQPPEGSPGLWLALEQGLPAVPETTEVLLGDLARLDFALTGWGEPDSASSESALLQKALL